jgi:hypothetical protein
MNESSLSKHAKVARYGRLRDVQLFDELVYTLGPFSEDIQDQYTFRIGKSLADPTV